MKFKSAPPKQWVYQPVAELNQPNPGPTTWYDILPVTRNCRVLSASYSVATTGEDILIKVTIDGEVLEGPQVAGAATIYYIYLSHIPGDPDQLEFSSTLSLTLGKSFTIEGKSVHIEMRKTTTNGAGTFTAKCQYEVLKP